MADNTQLNPGVGGDTMSTEDIGGVKVQRIKLATGGHGVDGGDVQASNPFPTRSFGPGTGLTTRTATSNSASVRVDSGVVNRRGFVVVNESSAVMYLKFGATAASTDYTVALAAGSTYESLIDGYTGRLDAILSTGSGFAQVTELS